MLYTVTILDQRVNVALSYTVSAGTEKEAKVKAIKQAKRDSNLPAWDLSMKVILCEAAALEVE